MIKTISINEGLTKYKNDIKIPLNSQSAIIFGNNGSGKSSLSKLFFYGNKLIDNSSMINKYHSLKNVTSDNFNVIINFDNTRKRTIYSKEGITNNLLIPTFNEQYIFEKIGINKHFSENKIENNKYLAETIQTPLKLEYEQLLSELNISNSSIKNKQDLFYELINRKVKKLLSEISSSSNALSIEKILEFIELNKTKKRFTNVDIEKLKHLQFLESIKNIDKLYEGDPFFQLIVPPMSVEKYQEIILEINNLIPFDENNSKVEYARDYFEKLETNFRKWKIDGTQYIENKKCPFCNTDISNNSLVENYILYSESKMNECIDILEQSKNFIINDSTSILRQLSFLSNTYNNLREIIPHDIYNHLNNITDNYQKLIDTLLNAINKKLEKQNIGKDCSKIIETINDEQFISFLNSDEQLNNDIREINKIITKINSLKNQKQREFLTNIGIKIIFNEVKPFYDELKDLKLENHKINKQFVGIEKLYKEELKKNNKILYRLNELLQYLNISDYSIDENFDLQLCSHAIDTSDLYLSEGEKTAISFALFVAELEFSENSFDTIVIDDPISSLDYNRIYSLYTLIEELIQKQKEKQFIILTHNALFYNLLSYGVNQILPNNEKVFNFFKLQKDIDDLTDIVNDVNPCSTIYINKALEIFRLNETGINGNSKNYIHNYCRYILETIYNFEHPELTTTKASKQLIDVLKKDNKFCSKPKIGKRKLDVYKNLINKGSHASINEIFDKETYDDIDYQNACYITMEIIKYKFPCQFDFLRNVYNKENKTTEKQNDKSKRKV